MGMSSASSVSLTSLSAAQGIPVRQIITWPLDSREHEYLWKAKVCFFNNHLKKGEQIGHTLRQLLTTASTGTGFFDDPVVKNPVPEHFFDDLYIRGFITSLGSLLIGQMGCAVSLTIELDLGSVSEGYVALGARWL